MTGTLTDRLLATDAKTGILSKADESAPGFQANQEIRW